MKRINRLVGVMLLLIGGIFGLLVGTSLQSVGAHDADQVQPTGWQMTCNGVVICQPLFTPTPEVPILTSTPTRTMTPTATVTRTVTPKAPISITPTKLPTPLAGSCTIPDSYPCIVGSDSIDYLVVATVNIRTEYRATGGSATIVGQRHPGDHVSLECFVHISAQEIWGSAQFCGAIAPTWTAILYNGVPFMVQSEP